MKIKSNALPQELDSPFYQANKQFCHDFEKFIASKKGKVKGSYNAWSYIIYGKVEAAKTWDLKYKKATYSGGNIFLSYKEQNLLVLAEWTCEGFATKDTFLLVRKQKLSDRLNPRYSALMNTKKYVIRSNKKKKDKTEQFLAVLAPLFESKQVYRISLRNSKLTIEFRSDQHHFDIFNQLIQL